MLTIFSLSTSYTSASVVNRKPRNETLEKLHHEVRIDAPLDKVWQTIADLESVRFYNPWVKTVRYTSQNREGVGAARHCDFKDGTSMEEKVIEYEPKRSISFECYNHQWPVEFIRWTTKV
ncbi:MAG: SRPBCC family protein [Nitrososphaerales archaeon]